MEKVISFFDFDTTISIRFFLGFFKRKVVALVNSFSTVCRTPLAHKEIRSIPDF